MQRGYLKLWRKIQDHRVYQNADLLKLFLHLLMNANIVDKTWNGDVIRRGELACGRDGLAKDLREKSSTVYKRLQCLAGPNYNLIRLRSNNHYTVVTILNYDTYQPTKLEVEQQGSSEVTARYQQGSTTKELKNERRREEEEKEGFSDSIGEAVRRIRKTAQAQLQDQVLLHLDLWLKDFPGMDIAHMVQKTLKGFEEMAQPPVDAVAFFLDLCKTEQAHRKSLGVETVEQVVRYLNEKTGKSFRPGTEATARAIRARQVEGYTLDDFKIVIDNKCADWLSDPAMEPHLNPDTLFRPGNFEKYRNQLNAGAKHGQNGSRRGNPGPYESAAEKRERANAAFLRDLEEERGRADDSPDLHLSPPTPAGEGFRNSAA